MAQKKVSFEVAKALKEACYPQGDTPYQYVTKNYDTFKEGEVIDSFYENWAGNNVIDIPTYLSTWLWLWREKGIMVDTSQIGGKVDAEVYTSDEEVLYVGNELHDDPEEAIAKAIDYLVDNDLIK